LNGVWNVTSEKEVFHTAANNVAAGGTRLLQFVLPQIFRMFSALPACQCSFSDSRLGDYFRKLFIGRNR